MIGEQIRQVVGGICSNAKFSLQCQATVGTEYYSFLQTQDDSHWKTYQHI